MINIQNKEAESCAVKLVDINGNVCYETRIQPNDYLNLDINALFAGIYTLIFYTDTTSFMQQIVKYW